MADGIARPSTRQRPATSGWLRALAVLGLLFVFLVGVKGLGGGFKLLGRDLVEAFFTATANPFVGLMVGILATTLVQSSSVTTSMIVGLVAAPEDPLPIMNAIPMVMGANIGTTVTNSIVSLAHMGRRDEFGRAFAVATCHDFFNYIAVAVLLPLELFTGVLGRTAAFLASRIGGFGGMEYESPIERVIQLGVTPIEALGRFLFPAGRGAGIVVIVLSGALIYVALMFVVRVMRAAMETRVEGFVTRALGRSMVLSLAIGAVATVMVQSSSITTSLLVPLAGAGLITLDQAFPITVGANIGTTITALLASLAASGPHAEAGLTIALVHLLFNVAGTALILPWERTRRIPLGAARRLAAVAVRSRRWALVYVVILFYLLPGALAVTSRLIR